MTRLPTPGADNDTWGDILNSFLEVEHNADGTQKTLDITKGGTGATSASSALSNLGGATDSAVVHLSGSETISGTKTFSVSPTVPTPTNSTDAVTKSYVDSATSAGAPDATTTNKGIVQLAGDLGGTAASPTVPGLANKVGSVTAGDSTITVGGTSTAPTVAVNAIAESQVTNLTTDLAAKVPKSTVTAKGDLIAATSSGTVSNVAVGADGTVLTADSTQAAGVSWASAATPEVDMSLLIALGY